MRISVVSAGLLLYFPNSNKCASKTEKYKNSGFNTDNFDRIFDEN